MARKKTLEYETTAFGRMISKLEKERGYSEQYVIDHVVDSLKIPIINDLQVYGSYKSGKRKSPRDFPTVLQAFANFYGVTTDYLLELEETPNHQVKSVQDSTGLSEMAVRSILELNKNHPDVMKMLDIILTGFSAENSTYLVSLYNQIYSDYKDKINNDTSSSYNYEKLEQRLLKTQSLYGFLSDIVQNSMSDIFDKQILQEEDENNYYHSQDYYQQNYDVLTAPPIAEVQIEHEDGTIEILKPESIN